MSGPTMTPVQEAPPPVYSVPEAPQTVPAPLEWQAQRVAPTGPVVSARATLRPGATYRLTIGHEWPDESLPGVAAGAVVEVTVPASGWFLEKGAVVKGQVNGSQPDVAGVRAMSIDRVASGGCDRLRRRWVDPGPRPIDLATALPRSYGLDVLEQPEPVRAFGHEGVHVILQVHAEPDAGRCLDFNLATYRSMTWFAEIVELWIVDVHGRRVVIERSAFPQTSERVLAQQRVMIATIRILGP
ncbi:hypothetical protein ACWEOW_02925 [Monashia sp. NPDC004114]